MAVTKNWGASQREREEKGFFFPSIAEMVEKIWPFPCKINFCWRNPRGGRMREFADLGMMWVSFQVNR